MECDSPLLMRTTPTTCAMPTTHATPTTGIRLHLQLTKGTAAMKMAPSSFVFL